jgi:hypothetical protein
VTSAGDKVRKDQGLTAEQMGLALIAVLVLLLVAAPICGLLFADTGGWPGQD